MVASQTLTPKFLPDSMVENRKKLEVPEKLQIKKLSMLHLQGLECLEGGAGFQ